MTPTLPAARAEGHREPPVTPRATSLEIVEEIMCRLVDRTTHDHRADIAGFAEGMIAAALTAAWTSGRDAAGEREKALTSALDRLYFAHRCDEERTCFACDQADAALFPPPESAP